MQIATDTSQVKDLLNNSQKILLATTHNSSVDGIASMLALGTVLRAQEKAITCLSEEFNKEKFAFLPGSDKVLTKLPPKSLVVSIDLKGNPIEKINYETKNGRLDLTITPKHGEISAESIEFFETDLNFDLIITLNVSSLSLLGKIAQVHAQSLEKIPILNVDAGLENAQFGKINYIDETASSVCEALFSLLQTLGFSILPESATALMSGIVEKTKGFSKNVSAQTFTVAAQLTQLGADLNLVNQNIFMELPMPIKQNLPNEQSFIR